MNHLGVLSSYDEFVSNGLEKYSRLEEEGNFIVTLKHRYWGKELSLGCYFERENGEKVYLYAWYRKIGKETHYCPRKSDICFENIEDGTKWLISTRKNSKGNVVWVTAEKLN